jgi:acetolactate decarboxylase
MKPQLEESLLSKLLLVAFAALLLGAAAATEDRDVLYQVSTIDALMQSVYDGIVSCKELKEHGDLGIGTFDCLEGEMVVYNGTVYQVKADGKAYKVNDTMTTPFATITFFEADRTIPLEATENLTLFTQAINQHLPSKNLFYALRIDGHFPYVKARSVPKQSKPYPRLSDAVANQTVFELQDV